MNGCLACGVGVTVPIACHETAKVLYTPVWQQHEIMHLKGLQELASLMCESAMLAAAGACHLAARALKGPCAAYRAAAFVMTAAAGVLLHVRLQ
jgi:hypothetical protein